MIFCGIEKTESIHLHPIKNVDSLCVINLTMDKHEPMFYVHCSESLEWFWEFWFTSSTDYERVKQCIIDVATELDSVEETLDVLSEIFVEYFSKMLVLEDDDCNCCCND